MSSAYFSLISSFPYEDVSEESAPFLQITTSSYLDLPDLQKNMLAPCRWSFCFWWCQIFRHKKYMTSAKKKGKIFRHTLPETHLSGRYPSQKETFSSSKHPVLGANLLLVSGKSPTKKVGNLGVSVVFFRLPGVTEKVPIRDRFHRIGKHAWHMADAQREGFEGASLEGFEQHVVMSPT